MVLIERLVVIARIGEVRILAITLAVSAVTRLVIWLGL